MSIAAILRDVKEQQLQWERRLDVTDISSPNHEARRRVLGELQAISVTTHSSSALLLENLNRKRASWLLKAEAEPATSPLYFTYLAASATFGDIIKDHQEATNG